MIRVSRCGDIRTIRAIKSLLEVDGDWQAIIDDYFAESCNRFVAFARLKFPRSHRRGPICKRPQIPVFMHKDARGEHRSPQSKKAPAGSPGLINAAQTICKPTRNVPVCCIGPTDWVQLYPLRRVVRSGDAHPTEYASQDATDSVVAGSHFDAAYPLRLGYATNGIGEILSATALSSIDLVLTMVSKQ
jgi:hypothetical protein